MGRATKKSWSRSGDKSFCVYRSLDKGELAVDVTSMIHPGHLPLWPCAERTAAIPAVADPSRSMSL